MPVNARASSARPLTGASPPFACGAGPAGRPAGPAASAAPTAAGPEPGIDAPVYTPAEVARHLRLPVGTVRWWTLGSDERPGAIRVAGAPHGELLSFRNLAEVHVLSALLWGEPELRGRRADTPLAAVRPVLAALADRFGHAHPLADERMEREGKALVAASLAEGRHALGAAVAARLTAYLARVHRDDRGAPARLLPFTGARADGPGHVMIEAAVCGGRPCLSGRAVPTAVVASRFYGGATVCSLAASYGCETDQIEEAIRYESAMR
jgi:uncharacterized protein (DUF433 family)